MVVNVSSSGAFSQRRPTTLRAKVLIVGDEKVGKTSIVQMITSDGTHFPKQYNMTVGVEETLKNYLVPNTSDSVEMYFFDCSGKESLYSKSEQFWEDASIIIAVFDFSQPQSLRNVTKWVDRAMKQAGEMTPSVVLVGNKKDLDNDYYNTPERAQDVDTLCKKYGAKFFEVCAKDNMSLEEPFKHACQLYHDHFITRIASITSN